MRIWYDACTGKQIRYATAIAQRLRKSGHEFVFTTREHPDTIPLARILGEKPIVIGKKGNKRRGAGMENKASRGRKVF